MKVIQDIKQWAKDRNLHEQDPKVQLSKLMEESGELAKAILKDDTNEQIDAMLRELGYSLIEISVISGNNYNSVNSAIQRYKKKYVQSK